MQTAAQFLIFGLNGSRFALSLKQVQRVVRAVAVTPVPDPPPGIRGVINVAGKILPVVDLRPQLHLPVTDIKPSDYLILVDNGRNCLALLVNEVLWIINRGEGEIMPAADIFPGLGHIQGIVKVDQEIILIHDLADQELPSVRMAVPA